MKKIVVFGGEGFCGKAIVKELLEKPDVEVYVSDVDSKFFASGSILDRGYVRCVVQGAHTVYQIAGLLGTSELIKTNVDAIRTNIEGTTIVLEESLKAGVKSFFYPTKPNEWLNTYSITKSAGEEFVRMFGKLHGLGVKIVRWLNIYGPGQHVMPVRKAVPTMILQGLEGWPIEIYGDGSQPVDLQYIDDIARLTVKYAELPGAYLETRDLGATIRISVLETAELVRELTGKRSEIKHLPMRRGEDQEKVIGPINGFPVAVMVEDSKMEFYIDGFEKTVEFYELSYTSEERVKALKWHKCGRY